MGDGEDGLEIRCGGEGRGGEAAQRIDRRGEGLGIAARGQHHHRRAVERLLVAVVEVTAVLAKELAMVGDEDDNGIAIGHGIAQLGQEAVGGKDGVVVGVDDGFAAEAGNLLVGHLGLKLCIVGGVMERIPPVRADGVEHG